MSGLILLCAVSTCCWSLMDYRRDATIVTNDKKRLDSRTTEFVQTKLYASAKSHAFFHREWLLLRWGCQLITTMKPHRGDPYLRSQRVLVFANALLVSLVCSILFYPVLGEPECCTCIADVCGQNSSSWSHGNKSCGNLSIVEGDEHCEEGEEVDNGILSAILCAALSLPIVATMHLSFRWVRKPLERFIMVKVSPRARSSPRLVAAPPTNKACSFAEVFLIIVDGMVAGSAARAAQHHREWGGRPGTSGRDVEVRPVLQSLLQRPADRTNQGDDRFAEPVVAGRLQHRGRDRAHPGDRELLSVRGLGPRYAEHGRVRLCN